MSWLLFAIRNVLDKLRKIMRGRGTLKFYVETYLLSRFDRVDPDIYVISYPKCGRTWLRVMLHRYLELSGHELRLYNDRALLGVVGGPTIKFEHDQGNWVPAPRHIHQLSFRTEKYRGKKVIFLTRDPRDVLVSAWYHLTYRERILDMPLSEFVRDPLVGVHKIITFTNMWLDNKHIPARFLLMTYEAIHVDPYASFAAALELMDYEVERSRLEQAIEASSFDKMKQMEKSGVLKEPWMKPGAKESNASMKVRKGQIGGYREELSSEDIAYIDAAIRVELNPDLPYHTP